MSKSDRGKEEAITRFKQRAVKAANIGAGGKTLFDALKVFLQNASGNYSQKRALGLGSKNIPWHTLASSSAEHLHRKGGQFTR